MNWRVSGRPLGFSTKATYVRAMHTTDITRVRLAPFHRNCCLQDLYLASSLGADTHALNSSHYSLPSGTSGLSRVLCLGWWRGVCVCLPRRVRGERFSWGIRPQQGGWRPRVPASPTPPASAKSPWGGAVSLLTPSAEHGQCL